MQIVVRVIKHKRVDRFEFHCIGMSVKIVYTERERERARVNNMIGVFSFFFCVFVFNERFVRYHGNRRPGKFAKSLLET